MIEFRTITHENPHEIIDFTVAENQRKFVSPNSASHNYCIWRFMIDAKYQRQGYGKAAIQEAVKYMRSFRN